ncbi:MAG: peptidylprolyl isomerase [Bacteroidota bacterium]
MNKLISAVLLFFILSVITSCDDKKDYLVKIKTAHGDITVLLYDETPLHKKNFLELAKSGRYDSTVFHRISENFMIQGGDIAKKEGIREKEEDRIPAEIVEGFYHTRGALAAARQGDNVNPEKKSSSTQFYIVDGQPWEQLSIDIQQLYGRMVELLRDSTNRELIEEYQPIYARRDQKEIMDFLISKQEMVEEKFDISLAKSPATGNDSLYQKMGGGYPPLDGAYTVFGQVVEGLDVVDRIAELPTSVNPQTGEKSVPIEPIPLTMEVVEMKKKAITETYGYQYPE